MTEASDQNSIEEEPKTVSQCPVCRYSLVDLAMDQPCPECGVEIDRELIESPDFHSAIAVTKTWNTFGGLGWIIFAFGYWAISMVDLLVRNSYNPGSRGSNDFVGVWLRTAFVIAPIALSVSWLFGAQRTIYLKSIKDRRKRTRVPKRVIVLGFIGAILGVFGLAITLLLISAAA